MEAAHAQGLRVHPWTFRNESQFLDPFFQSEAAAEYRFFTQLGVDGFFTEFPRTARHSLEAGGRAH